MFGPSSFMRAPVSNGPTLAPTPKVISSMAVRETRRSASIWSFEKATASGQVTFSSTAAASKEALAFFKWALEEGQAEAKSLDYVSLPAGLVKQIEAYWTKSAPTAP